MKSCILWTISALGLALLLSAGALVLMHAGQTPSSSSIVQAKTDTEKPLPRTITVIGEGKIKTKPDMAQAVIGVEVNMPKFQRAWAEAGKKMDRVLETLKAQGIEDKDIRTSEFNIWEGNRSVYYVSHHVTVTIRDLEKVGTILDAAVEAGIDSTRGITFDLADPGAVQSETRKTAMADAKVKADELAASIGAKVGEVVNVSEVIRVPDDGSGYASRSSGSGFGRSGLGSSVQPGELEMSTRLQVVYTIQ